MVLITLLLESWHDEYTATINHHHDMIRLLTKKHLEELIQLQLQIQKKTPHTPNRKPQIKPRLTLNDNPIETVNLADYGLAVKADVQEEPVLHYEIQENPIVTQHLEQQTFKFSEKTRQRVTEEIRDVLKLKETEGLGPRDVGRKIREKFGQLKGYEAERIARTECNRASNTYRYNSLMDEDLIDYYMWISKVDNRTRGQKKHDKANHVQMDGEIIKKGGQFSNGLRFPCDPNGPAYEVINCRCTLIPYIIPYGKVAPNKSYFHESELLPRPEGDGNQLIIELDDAPLVDLSDGGFDVTPDSYKIGGTPTSMGVGIDARSKLSMDEQKKYDDLLFRLEKDGGKIVYDKKTEHYELEGGKLGLVDKMNLIDLHKKKLGEVTSTLTKQATGKPATTQKTLAALESELHPVKQKIREAKTSLDKLSDKEIALDFEDYNSYPDFSKMSQYDKKIKNIEKEIDDIYNSNDKFNIKALSKDKQKEWQKISEDILDTVKNAGPGPQFRRLKAKAKVFIKTSTNQFDINKLTSAEQKIYKELRTIQKANPGQLSISDKIKIKNLTRKGKMSAENMKKIDKLEKEINKIKDAKKAEDKRLLKKVKDEQDKIKEKIKALEAEQTRIENEMGQQYLQNHARPSQYINPSRQIDLNGKTFNWYDKIENDENEYHKFCLVHNSQKSNTPYGIKKYSEGSGHFNEYLKLKNDGASTEKIEDNILNALVHPQSIYKIKDKNIFKPLNSFDVKDDPSLVKGAVNTLKRRLHDGDPDIVKAYDEVLKGFKREEKDFLENAVYFRENIVTASGQSHARYGHLRVGDDWVAPKCVSSSLSNGQTNYFLRRRNTETDKPVKIYFYHQANSTKQVIIGERSLHPNEAEIVQLPGTHGKVIKRGSEKLLISMWNDEEITIDTLHILLD